MGVSAQCNHEFEMFMASVESSTLEVVELGDQDHLLLNGKCRDRWGFRFKSYTTLDLWKVSGVTDFDLSIYSPDSFRADIITNFGTSEHVEPSSGHYNCWKNSHSWLRRGGFIVSEVPEVGHWAGHGRFTYSHNFFSQFEKIGYKVHAIKNIAYPNQGNLVFSILRKESDSEFFNLEEFEKFVSIDATFNLNFSPTLNNPKGLAE